MHCRMCTRKIIPQHLSANIIFVQLNWQYSNTFRISTYFWCGAGNIYSISNYDYSCTCTTSRLCLTPKVSTIILRRLFLKISFPDSSLSPYIQWLWGSPWGVPKHFNQMNLRANSSLYWYVWKNTPMPAVGSCWRQKRRACTLPCSHVMKKFWALTRWGFF